MLRRNHQPDKILVIMDHSSGNRPVRSLAVRRLHDVHTVGLNVFSAIGLVNEWRL